MQVSRRRLATPGAATAVAVPVIASSSAKPEDGDGRLKAGDDQECFRYIMRITNRQDEEVLVDRKYITAHSFWSSSL